MLSTRTSVGTISTTKPEQIETMESDDYSRRTCNIYYVRSVTTGRVVARCDPQAGTSTSFVDRTIDLPWRNFAMSTAWGKVPGGSSLIFEGRPARISL